MHDSGNLAIPEEHLVVSLKIGALRLQPDRRLIFLDGLLALTQLQLNVSQQIAQDATSGILGFGLLGVYSSLGEIPLLIPVLPQ